MCVLYFSKCNMKWICVFSLLVNVNKGVYVGYQLCGVNTGI